MSKIRKCESDETDEMMEGERGAKAALYVQEWVGRVSMLLERAGDHCMDMSACFNVFPDGGVYDGVMRNSPL